jgi:hypothetical protein
MCIICIGSGDKVPFQVMETENVCASACLWEPLGLDFARKMCEGDYLAVRKTVWPGREG